MNSNKKKIVLLAMPVLLAGILTQIPQKTIALAKGDTPNVVTAQYVPNIRTAQNQPNKGQSNNYQGMVDMMKQHHGDNWKEGCTKMMENLNDDGSVKSS